MTDWGDGLVPGSNEVYLLLRRGPDGALQGIRFTRGIVRRMDIDEHEWNALTDSGMTAGFDEISPGGAVPPPTRSGERGKMGTGGGTTRRPHAPATATARRKTGPCSCPCTAGGFCGGCGHAGCGRRAL